MPLIKIAVNNKKAESPKERIVCGNSDFVIQFLFDDEWSAYETKTARFIYAGEMQDVVFTGDTCPVPVISKAAVCDVGVFAGNLHTTTPALIACDKSILCDDGVPADPAPDVYAQIMELLNSGGGGNGFSPTVDVAEIDGGHRVSVTDINGTKSFDVMDGADGKDGDPGADGQPGKDGAPGANGYTPQKGIDYFTEADKAEMVDAVLAALPTYNGEVEEV